jgi:hypothetical protein
MTRAWPASCASDAPTCSHARSTTVLSRLPGLTYAMVDRIMGLRTGNGGFVSAEEMAVHADLPPSIVSEIAEYALFIR